MVTEAITGCRPNLLVTDLDGSLRFYAERLGFHVGWHWSDRRGRFFDKGEDAEPGEPGTAIVSRDGVQLLLTQLDGPRGTWLLFDVPTADQVDALFQEWTERGAVITEPPSLRPWGVYEMRLADPDGHVLRVGSPPHASTG